MSLQELRAGFVVGLTGGIGCGKSAAAGRFSALGAALVDVDVIAHELTGPGGAAIANLSAAFGPRILAEDGRLDRPAMRRLAFADLAARRRLEAVLHPMIRESSVLLTRQALAANAPYVVLVVPLLVESGDYRQRVSRIAVVDCADETRIARVAARSGLARDEIEGIMAAQASRQERLAVADDVIHNDGDLAELSIQVEKLHRQYLQFAADPSKCPITG
jgi:dephospho-CoA kinase